jgi:hypothetical protein
MQRATLTKQLLNLMKKCPFAKLKYNTTKNRPFSRAVFKNIKSNFYFTDATKALKASGSFIARSASILRLRSIPFSAIL